MSNNDEQGYLNLIRNVLQNGRLTTNRTGILTKTIFGAQLRYNCRNNKLAMLTTKFISFSNVLHELLWFIRGNTNQKLLAENNVKIWRDNSTREFLDSRKLYHYKEFETLGPIYGFQWRHFGAKYIDSKTDYNGQGVDQLQICLNQIRNDPQSRRIIMSAWNPSDLDKMALPPCHVMIQFDVDESNQLLSGHMYQRSADLMLGVPYNLLSYSLLLHIMAKKSNLEVGDLICSYGNLHIYENHIDNAKIQLERVPMEMPNLILKNFNDDINFDNLHFDMFKLNNYKYHPGRLNFQMAV